MMIEAANAVCELTRLYKELKKEHWDALIYLVKYLKQEQENIKLTIRPPKVIQFVKMVAANFATENEERKIVTGGIFTIEGSIIGQSLKTQSCTAIFSMETEYDTMSHGAPKLLLV